jgi:hypothetical protein
MDKDAYIKQLEKQNEELQRKAAEAESELSEVMAHKVRSVVLRQQLTNPIGGGLKRGEMAVHSAPSLMFAASIVLDQCGYDEFRQPLFIVTKNRTGKQGITISRADAEKIMNGNYACLEK